MTSPSCRHGVLYVILNDEVTQYCGNDTTTYLYLGYATEITVGLNITDLANIQLEGFSMMFTDVLEQGTMHIKASNTTYWQNVKLLYKFSLIRALHTFL